MIAKVKCQNPGHEGRSRARRRFKNGVEYTLDVIDQAEDFFADVEKTAGDMTRCNLKAFLLIKADPCFSVLESAEASDGAAAEVIERVKAHASTLAGKLSDAMVEIESLKAKLSAVTKERDEAKDLVASQASDLEALTAPKAVETTATVPAARPPGATPSTEVR